MLALRHLTSAKDVADLISATASLLWPILAFMVITWFRPELRALLARIRKGKFLGQEIELDQMLDKTNEAVVEAETVSAATGTAEGTSSAVAQAAPIDDRTRLTQSRMKSRRFFGNQPGRHVSGSCCYLRNWIGRREIWPSLSAWMSAAAAVLL